MTLQNFLLALAETLSLVINLYIWIIIISALITWVQPNPYNPIVQILNRLTSPAYRVVKKLINPVFGMVDLTPLIIILTLQFLNIFLVRSLQAVAYGIT